MKKIVALFVLLLALTACSNTSADPLPTNSKNDASSEPIEAAKLEDLKFASYSLPASDYYDHVDAIKLDVKDGADDSTVTIANTVNKWIANQIADFQKNAKVAYKQEKSMSKVMEYNLTFDESAKSENIYAITFTDYRFEGGAHGSSIIKTFAFDLRDGSEITLVSQIDPQKRSQFNALCAKALGEQAGTFGKTLDSESQITSNLNDDSFFSGWFASRNDGIAIIFPQYSVGPYSSGQPAISLAWNEVKDYFKADSVLISEFAN